MSQTSVGSGTPNDRNENPAPSDGYPSRTFGAESSVQPEVPPFLWAPLAATEAATDAATDASSLEPAESDAADLPSPMDASIDAALGAGIGQGMPDLPDLPEMPDIPDGPNVGPSAWELRAAQGEPDPRDPAPQQSSGV